MKEKHDFDLTETKSIKNSDESEVKEKWSDSPFKWSFMTKHTVDIGGDPRNIGVEVVFKVKDKHRLNEMQNLMRRTIKEVQEEAGQMSAVLQSVVRSIVESATKEGSKTTLKDIQAMFSDPDDNKKKEHVPAYAFLKVQGKDDELDKLLRKHLPHIAKCEGNFNLTSDLLDKFDPKDHTDFIVGFCDYFLDRHRVMETVY